MIVYEVNLEIDRAIEAAYRPWLRAHIAEILSLPGFVSAEVFEPEENAEPNNRLALCVQYRLQDRDALAAYFEQHAPRLRAEGIARFGDGFTARRRVLRSTTI